MDWNIISTAAHLDEILQQSHVQPQLIFKHSTRCSISSLVKNRFDKVDALQGVDVWYLDLIANRSLSNEIAERFSVHHESPQVILLKNGEVIFDESHLSIDLDEIATQALG